MVSFKSEGSNITTKYHPIIYFLITLLNYDKNKNTKSYSLLKKYFETYNIKPLEDSTFDSELSFQEGLNTVNNQLQNIKLNNDESIGLLENDGNYNNSKIDIIDVIYKCIEEYGQRIVDIARLSTIKRYYSKTTITNQTVYNIFIIMNLGYLVFSDNEWYKFSYNRNGWEKISPYDLAREINLYLMNELSKLCSDYNFSLEGLTANLSSFFNNHTVIHNNLYQLETFFYSQDFMYRMDKRNVLRFNDCVYDFNIKAPRPGQPNDFCLKSTKYNYHTEYKSKVGEVKQFLKDIFVEEELINYVLKIVASTLTLGNKLRSILFFIGSGRNGKTTFTNMISIALGDYAATPNVSLFLGKSVSADKPSPHMVDLNNARIAICEEPDARCINITGDAKSITGNVGNIKTRSLYKDLKIVYVDLLPIINTNDKLTISNLDNALIDRILVIPFTQRFVNKMNISILSSNQNIKNPSIKHANTMWQGSRVQGYAEALIHILIENYQDDYTSLEIPQMVIDATKNFIMRSDHIARFLEKNIIDKNDNYAIPIDEVYSCYKNWYKQFVSNRTINYSLENFRMDLIKYSIRIINIPTNDSKRTVESIIGYRIIN